MSTGTAPSSRTQTEDPPGPRARDPVLVVKAGRDQAGAPRSACGDSHGVLATGVSCRVTIEVVAPVSKLRYHRAVRLGVAPTAKRTASWATGGDDGVGRAEGIRRRVLPVAGTTGAGLLVNSADGRVPAAEAVVPGDERRTPVSVAQPTAGDEGRVRGRAPCPADPVDVPRSVAATTGRSHPSKGRSAAESTKT